jgi:hypothetical protein
MQDKQDKGKRQQSIYDEANWKEKELAPGRRVGDEGIGEGGRSKERRSG